MLFCHFLFGFGLISFPLLMSFVEFFWFFFNESFLLLFIIPDILAFLIFL